MSSPASSYGQGSAQAAAAGQAPADKQLQSHKVYISHATDSVAFVTALTARLESAGLQVTASSCSDPVHGLTDSKTVVVVLSRDYVHSAEGNWELVLQSKQCRQDQNLLPVHIPDRSSLQLPGSTAMAQTVDAVSSVVWACIQVDAHSDAGLAVNSIEEEEEEDEDRWSYRWSHRWLMDVAKKFAKKRAGILSKGTLGPESSSIPPFQDVLDAAPIRHGMWVLRKLQRYGVLAEKAEKPELVEQVRPKAEAMQKPLGAEQELLPLLADALDSGLLIQFTEATTLDEQQAVFTRLAEHGFFKLRTTKQGHVFATSGGIQSLYTGSTGNQPQQQQQQHHTSVAGSSAAASTGAPGATSGLGWFSKLLGSGAAAQPAVATTPGSSGSSNPCQVQHHSNLVQGVPQANSEVEAAPCSWQPCSYNLVSFAGGKWTQFNIQASGQHSDVHISFRVHTCVKASGAEREICLTVEELCGKLHRTSQRPAALANLPASNPLGLLWVQLTVAAEEGGLPMVLKSQQAHSACGLALQQFTEIPAQDMGGWYLDSVTGEFTASPNPSFKVGATAKNARPSAPGDAKELNVLLLQEVTRHLLPRGVSFQLIRNIENTARCQRDYDLDYAGMLTNNSIYIKGELGQVSAGAVPPPLKLMVAVELAWAAQPFAEPDSKLDKLSKVFKRAEAFKPLRLVFTSSATADVEPTQLIGQC